MFESTNKRMTRVLSVFQCVEIMRTQEIRIQLRQWWIADFLHLKMNDP